MDDSSIPYTESVRIADAVSGKTRVRLALLPHIEQRTPDKPSAKDLYQRYALGGSRLFSAIYDLLEKSGLEKQ
jgi:hypothetical protein